MSDNATKLKIEKELGQFKKGSRSSLRADKRRKLEETFGIPEKHRSKVADGGDRDTFGPTEYEDVSNFTPEPAERPEPLFVGQGVYTRNKPFEPYRDEGYEGYGIMSRNQRSALLNSPEGQELAGAGYSSDEIVDALALQLKNPGQNILGLLPKEKPENYVEQPEDYYSGGDAVRPPVINPVTGEVADAFDLEHQQWRKSPEVQEAMFRIQTGMMPEEYEAGLKADIEQRLEGIRDRAEERMKDSPGNQVVKELTKPTGSLWTDAWNSHAAGQTLKNPGIGGDDAALATLTSRALGELRSKTKKDKAAGDKSSGVWRGITGSLTLDDLLSMGWSQLGELSVVNSALEKYNAGEPLSDLEKDVVELKHIEQDVQEYIAMRGGKTGGQMVGEGVGQSIPFMESMLFTGGVGAGAAKAVAKNVGKGLLKKGVPSWIARTAQTTANMTASSLAMTPLQAATPKNYLQRTIDQYTLTPDGIVKNETSAFGRGYKAFAESFTEVFSEHFGDALGGTFRLLSKKYGTNIALLNLMGVGVKDSHIARLKERLLWDGTLYEFSEEMLGNIMSPLLTGETEKIKENFSKENVWTTFLTVALMGGGFSALEVPNTVGYGIRSNQLKNAENNALKSINNHELKDQVYQAMHRPTVKEQAAAMSEIDWSNTEYSLPDVANAVDYARFRNQVGIFKSAGRSTAANREFEEITQKVLSSEYRTPEGRASGVLVTAKASDGGVYSVVSGDYNSNDPQAVIVGVDSEGNKKMLSLSEITTVEEVGTMDYLSQRYAELSSFGAAREMVGDIQQETEDAQAVGVSPDVIAESIAEEPFHTYRNGDQVTTTSGVVGNVVGRSATGYNIQLEDGEYLFAKYAEVLQPGEKLEDVLRQQVEAVEGDVQNAPDDITDTLAGEDAAAESTSVQPERAAVGLAAQPEAAAMEWEELSEVPTAADGTPDFERMSPIMLANQLEILLGTREAARDWLTGLLDENRKEQEKQTLKRPKRAADINKLAAAKIALQQEGVRLERALSQYEDISASEPQVTEQASSHTAVQAKPQPATPDYSKMSNREFILKAYPDGAPNLYMQVLFDIIRGQKFVWDDSPNGYKHGIARELGKIGENAHRKSYFNILASPDNGGVYIEDYIEHFYFDDSLDMPEDEIRNIVLEVLTDVNSAGAAGRRVREIYAKSGLDESVTNDYYEGLSEFNEEQLLTTQALQEELSAAEGAEIMNNLLNLADELGVPPGEIEKVHTITDLVSLLEAFENDRTEAHLHTGREGESGQEDSSAGRTGYSSETVESAVERGNEPAEDSGDREGNQIGETDLQSLTPAVDAANAALDANSSEIDQAATAVDTNPTEAQKEAGNYRKAHINVNGFDITIENPKGSVRSGVDENGNPWSNTLNNHYGYFKRTMGKDGDQIDVFIGDYPESSTVYVVDQINPETGSFDEHKIMLGFDDMEQAQAAYLSNYDEGWQGLGGITPVDIEEFRKWLDNGTRKRKPFAEYESVTPEITAPAVPERNRLVSDEKYEELKARLREKLANLNAGIDPELISIGAQLAVYHIENGAIKFADYAKRMVDEFGEAIRPYLRSFYESARYMPGMEDMARNMTPSSDIDSNKTFKSENNEYDRQREENRAAIETKTAAIENQVAAVENEAAVIERSRKSKGKRRRVNEQLNIADTLFKDIDEVEAHIDEELRLLGYYDSSGHKSKDITELGNKRPEKKFKADLEKYAKSLAKELGGWEHDTDRKGRRIIASTNVPPAGGSGTIILWHPDSKYGVYVSVDVNPAQGSDVEALQVEPSHLVWRITSKDNKYIGYQNRYAPIETSTKQLAGIVKKEITPYLAKERLQKENQNIESDEIDRIQLGEGEARTSGGVPAQATEGSVPQQSVATEGRGRTESVRSDGEGKDARGTVSGNDQRRNLGGRTPVDSPDGRPDARRETSVDARRQQDGEIPRQDVRNSRNYTIQRGQDVAPRGDVTKTRANMAAIRLAKELSESGREATSEEKNILAKYTGWGGLSSVFQPGNQFYEQLRELLSEDEYESARASTTSSFYTPTSIISSLWDIVDRLGFKGGSILEPSAGIGHILGMMPQSIKNVSDIRSVELDAISGQILRSLYPDARVTIDGYENVVIPNNSVDLVVTNVPFGKIRLYDNVERDISARFDIHDYFIAKSIRKLRPGGIGVFITTTSTMDRSNELRNWLINEGNADVIGAVRLNSDTFKQNAGTEASSDIIVIRKRDESGKHPAAIDVSRVGIERTANYTARKEARYGGYAEEEAAATMRYNSYFIEHPEFMSGVMKFGFEGGNEMRPTEQRCAPEKGIEQTEVLERFVSSLPADIFDKSPARPEDEVHLVENTDSKYKEGNILLSDGVPCVVEYGMLKPLNWNKNKVAGRPKSEALTDYLNLKDTLNGLLDAELNDAAYMEERRRALNLAYDTFVSRYGYLSGNAKISFLRSDVDFPSISAIENVVEVNTPDGGKVTEVRKSDIFSRRVVNGETHIEVNNIDDAIKVSQYKLNALNNGYVASLLGTTPEAVVEEILETERGYINPSTGLVESREDYLSGNVIEKLKLATQANQNNEYTKNIAALSAVIPDTVPLHLINISLGANWIPVEVYNKFFEETFDVKAEIKLTGTDKYIGSISNKYNPKNESFSVKGYTGADLAMSAMNNLSPKVYESFWEDGQRKQALDRDATVQAGAKQQEIVEMFEAWCKQEENPFAEQLETLYNETFNAVIEKNYDVDSFTSFPNASTTKIPRRHQKEGVMRILDGATLLAHEVGTGKTITLISAAMEMKRLGLAKKPCIVVQRSTYKQFVNEIKSLYPQARVLVPSDQDLTKAQREQLFAKIAYNDWDIVVLYHSYLDAIPDDPVRVEQYIEQQIQDKLELIEELKDTREAKRMRGQLKKEIDKLQKEITVNRENRKASVKQEETAKAKAESKYKRLTDRRTDNVACFEQLGIDALLVDEAHAYKRLGFMTNIQNVKGIDTSASKRAQSMKLKSSYILENNGYRNVAFATGTPISNTMAEMWTYMRYLLPEEELRRLNIKSFDSFVHNFGEIEDSAEFGTNGKFRIVKRFSKYNNIPELLGIWRKIAHVVLTEEVDQLRAGVGTPLLETGKPIDVFLPQSAPLKGLMKSIKTELEVFENLSPKEKRERSYIPLVMFGLAKRGAIDVRLVNADLADDPNSKLNQAVSYIVKDLKETEGYRGAVAVFCDDKQSSDGRFVLFDDMRRKLVANGISEDEIAKIDDYNTDEKKQKLFDAVNSGNIRVVMGSTDKLGVGVNIQERLHMLVHLDAPMRPSDYQQRNGRILRQGNTHLDIGIPVKVMRFGVEQTLDVTGYQRLQIKESFIRQIMKGDVSGRTMEEQDVDSVDSSNFAHMMASLSGSEAALALTVERNKFLKLANAKKYHEKNQVFIVSGVRQNKYLIENAAGKIDALEKAKARHIERFPSSEITSIRTGDRFTDKPAEFGRLLDAVYGKRIEEIVAGFKKNASTDTISAKLPNLFVNGIEFAISMDVERKVNLANRTIKVTKSIKYDCVTFPDTLSDVVGASIERLIPALEYGFSTGSFDEQILAAQRDRERALQFNALNEPKIGEAFPKQAELEKSAAEIERLNELMREELAEIERREKEENEGVEAVSIDVAEQVDDEARAREGQTFEELFGQLDADYHALIENRENNSNFEKSFDAWKDQKARVVGDYFDGLAQRYGVGNSIAIFDSARDFEVLEQLYEDANSYDRDLLFDDFVKDYHTSDLALFYVPNYDAIYIDVDKIREVNSIEEFEDTFFHEVTHSITGKVVDSPSLREIYEESKEIPYFKRIIETFYPNASIFTKGNEILSYAIEFLNSPKRGKLVQRFLDGEIGVEQVIGRIKSDIPKTKNALLIILNRLKDERARTEGYESGTGGNEGDTSGHISRFRRQRIIGSGGSRIRGGRDIAYELNDLAWRFGITANVIYNLDDILHPNPKIQERRRSVRGWFDPATGDVSFVLPNIYSIADAQATFFHEAVGHKGMREVFGAKRYDKLLSQVWESLPATVQEKLHRKYGDNTSLAAEEYIASVAEGNVTPGIIRRIVGVVRQWFRSIGINLQITENDLVYLLWLASHRLAKGHTAADAVSSTASMARARARIYGEADDFRYRDVFDEEYKANEDEDTDVQPDSPSFDDARYYKLGRELGYIRPIWDDNDSISTPKKTNPTTEKVQKPAPESESLSITESIEEKLQREFGFIRPKQDNDEVAIIPKSKPAAEKTEEAEDVKKPEQETATSQSLFDDVLYPQAVRRAIEDFVRRNGITPTLLKQHYEGFITRVFDNILPEHVQKALRERGADPYVSTGRFLQFQDVKMLLGADLYKTLIDALESEMPDDAKQSLVNRQQRMQARKAKERERHAKQALADYELDKNADREFILLGQVINPKSQVKGAVRNIQDTEYPVKLLQKKLKKEFGVEIDHTTDIYNALNHWTSIANSTLERYQDRIVKPIMKSIAKIVDKTGQDAETVIDYITAESALERHQSGIYTIPDAENAKTSEWNMTVVEYLIANMREKLGDDADSLLSELWNNIDKANIWTLEQLEQGGLLTAEQRDRIRGHKWKYYVPLMGWDLEANGLVDPVSVYDFADAVPKTYSANVALNQAEGRATKPYNPIANMIHFGVRSTIAAKRNEAMQTALRLFYKTQKQVGANRTDPIFTISKIYYVKHNGMWMPVSPDMTPDAEVIAQSEYIRKQVRKLRFQMWDAQKRGEEDLVESINEKIEALEDMEEVRVVNNDKSFAGEIPIGMGEKMQRSIEVYENGVRNIITFADPAVANAIRGDVVGLIKLYDKTIARLTRWLSAAFTSLSIPFVVLNAAKDLEHAAIMHTIDNDNRNIANFARNIPKTFSAIYRGVTDKAKPLTVTETKGLDVTKTDDRGKLITMFGKKRVYDTLFDMFVMEGGQTGFVFTKEVSQIEREIKRYVAWNTKTGKNVLVRTGYTLAKGATAVNEWSRLIGEISENCSRFATFLASLDKGKTVFDAVTDAKNITVNFNRRGRYSRWFGSLYIFFNASVQSFAQELDVAKRNPKTYTAFVVTQMMQGFVNSWLAYFAMSLINGDDDDEPPYQIPQHVRSGNIVIPFFKSKGYAKIPLPQGLRVYHSWGTLLFDAMNGLISAEECANEMIIAMWDERMPVQAPENANFVRTIMPSIFIPFLDCWVGEDVFGRPVGRTRYSPITPNSELGLRNANEAIYRFCRMLNRLGGGDEISGAGVTEDDGVSEWKRALFEWNPSHIEHVLKYYAGGTIFGGTMFWDTWRTIQTAFDGDSNFDIRDVPVLNRIVGQAYQENPSNKYYERRNNLKVHHDQYLYYKKEGDPRADSDVVRKNEERYRFFQMFDKRRQKISSRLALVSSHDEQDEYEELSKELRDIMYISNYIDSNMDWDSDSWGEQLDFLLKQFDY